MKFKKYSNGAWTDAPYYIMKNGSWTSTTDVHEMDNGAWFPISSWDGFRSLVRSGTASSLYPIGTELYETWGDNTSNAWIIVDYDNNDYMDPDLTLQGYTHNVILMEKNINQLASFEDKQALLSLTQDLPPATYYITVPTGTGYTPTGGRDRSFTTTTGLTTSGPGQLTWTWKYHTDSPGRVQGYATAYSSLEAFNVLTSRNISGTNLGTLKIAMTDPDGSYGPLNFWARCSGDTTYSGSNNYYQSSLRQWINATTETKWWNPGCVFSRLWGKQSLPGKLYTLNSDMKSVLATPTIPCLTNNVFETGDIDGTPFALDTAYTVRDKMFIPSHTELGAKFSGVPTIGSTWSYFSTGASTKWPRTYNGTSTSYWLRSPKNDSSTDFYTWNSAGHFSTKEASTTSYGVICACTIQ